PPGKTAGIDAGSETLEIPLPVFTGITDYCAKHDTTVYKVLLSALALYINRTTGKKDFIIGAAGHNRTHGAENKEMAGMFVNTIPLRMKIPSATSFHRFVEHTGQEITPVIKIHQKYPFDLLIDELHEKTATDPLYMLNINLIDHGATRESNFETIRHFPGYEPTPLSIHILYKTKSGCPGNTLELEWDYRTAYFSKAHTLRMHGVLVNILSDALADPDKKLEEVSLLSGRERERILFTFNDTGAENPYPSCTPLPYLLAGQAERTPENIALLGPTLSGVQSQRSEVTYRELQAMVLRLARQLKAKGVGSGSIVPIMTEPSITMITGLLGILYAGGAYLPIAPSYPQERTRFMLADVESGLLLYSAAQKENIPEEGYSESLCLEEVILHQTSPEPAQPLHVLFDLSPISKEDLAYIIHTSGSTGRPKGVAVRHRNLTAYMNAFFNQFQLGETDAVVQQASFAFDAFVEELYPVLLKGGKLAVPLREEVVDAARLADFIAAHHVTMITCSPLMLNELNKQPKEALKSIRIFISGGDRLKSNYIDNLIQAGNVYNTYGPTEATVCATYYLCSPNDPENVSIGTPITGTSVYILDNYHQPLPVGIKGELCISGAGITAGYLNNPQLTADKFIPLQHGSNTEAIPPEQLYRTGDLARWLPNGHIEFIGRKDSQVSIRGYRIEPGEIENRLDLHHHISEAVVSCRKDENGDSYLCAYIVPKTTELKIAAVKKYLADFLPSYMLPSFIVPIEHIPLTPAGKPDLKALPDPKQQVSHTLRPPEGQIEEDMVTLWSDVLAIPRDGISVTADFFDLGGQSLKATKLAALIHRHFNVKISLADIFKEPYVRSLAQAVTQATRVEFFAVEQAEEREYYPLSSAQKRLYVMQQMEPQSIGYNVPVMVPLDVNPDRSRLENAFRKLIRRHESLRTAFIDLEGQPVQKILPMEDIQFSVDSFDIKKPASASLPGDEAQIMARFVRPFDLSSAPLLRVGLLQLEAEKFIVLTDTHHIVSDGASKNIFTAEFMAFYMGMELPPLRLQYRDYSQWQINLFQSGETAGQEAYWLNRFKGDIPVLAVPTDYPRESAVDDAGGILSFGLEEKHVRRFEEIAKDIGGSLFMVLLSVYSILLSKYARQEDVIIGTSTSGRTHADLEGIIGMFINMLPIRHTVSGQTLYPGFLKNLKTDVLDTFENQDYQFDDLVEKLGVQRVAGRSPIIDYTFTLNRLEGPGANTGDTGTGEEEQGSNQPTLPGNIYEHEVSKFDMLLRINETPTGMDCRFEYKQALFKESTIEKFKNHFLEIVEQVTSEEGMQMKLDDITLSHSLVAAAVVEPEEEDDDFDF
ncbi:MAG: amino acid adenylation domain-containing protein, partial [bacterium]|nr:amino acid adenylation domain-containing protein [bacterium]